MLLGNLRLFKLAKDIEEKMTSPLIRQRIGFLLTENYSIHCLTRVAMVTQLVKIKRVQISEPPQDFRSLLNDLWITLRLKASILKFTELYVRVKYNFQILN